MRPILLIALAAIYANYAPAQSTDTIELSDLGTSKAIKQASIFPNGAEYWERRIF